MFILHKLNDKQFFLIQLQSYKKTMQLASIDEYTVIETVRDEYTHNWGNDV